MSRYVLVPGARVEAIGSKWAVWSPSSGETLVLNDEAAAILEVLSISSSMDTNQVAEALSNADDTAEPNTSAIHVMIELSWPSLLTSGLVRIAAESFV